MEKTKESLRLSAQLAWQWAPHLCRKDPKTGEDCSLTHSMWQYLRLMGVQASIEPRTDFYLDAIRAISGTVAAPRLLISGAADYAMLDLVLTAFRSRGVVADITVADQCETPLALNRWYAERASCNIKTIRCDIMDFAADVPFDAVCADGFINWFPVPQRGALLEKWRGLLRPGGVVITATRLRPAGEGRIARFSTEQVKALRSTVARVAREMQPVLEVDPEELAARAEAYAAGYVTYAIHTAEEIRALFEEHGFEMSRLSLKNSPNSGTQIATNANKREEIKHYVTIVARRL